MLLLVCGWLKPKQGLSVSRKNLTQQMHSRVSSSSHNMQRVSPLLESLQPFLTGALTVSNGRFMISWWGAQIRGLVSAAIDRYVVIPFTFLEFAGARSHRYCDFGNIHAGPEIFGTYLRGQDFFMTKSHRTLPGFSRYSLDISTLSITNQATNQLVISFQMRLRSISRLV